MNYLAHHLRLAPDEMRKPTAQRYLSAFFFGVARLFDPSSNQTGADALLASHRRTAAELEQSPADDWRRTGDTLRGTVNAQREKAGAGKA
jgi:hypothetical protein